DLVVRRRAELGDQPVDLIGARSAGPGEEEDDEEGERPGGPRESGSREWHAAPTEAGPAQSAGLASTPPSPPIFSDGVLAYRELTESIAAPRLLQGAPAM